MVWRLLERRDLWAAVCKEESLIPAAVEESLRFDPPVLGLYRNTTRDVELHGTTIPAGSKVYINYAAANRDAGVFAGARYLQTDSRAQTPYEFRPGHSYVHRRTDGAAWKRRSRCTP